MPKKSTISASCLRRGVGDVDERVGAAQRVRQAAAGVRVDARAAAERHRLVARSVEGGAGELPDPAGAARDRDSHESSLSSLIGAITDPRYP